MLNKTLLLSDSVWTRLGLLSETPDGRSEKYKSIFNFFDIQKLNQVYVIVEHFNKALLKYIYKKIQLPLKVIDKKENFRRIIDHKNNNGWIHVSQLRKAKSFISLEDKIIFKKPSKFSKPIAQVKKGRLLLIKKCETQWCKIQTGEFLGWVNVENVWGPTNLNR